MITLRLWITAVILLMLSNCSHLETDAKVTGSPPRFNGEAEILQSWQGDFPVEQLNLLPELQRGLAVGCITDDTILDPIWRAFKPNVPRPPIDFKTELIIYTRNTRFFNRISIGKVVVTDGVAEVLAMETLSAIPIEDKVAMSMVVVSRVGITAIQTSGGLITVVN